MNKGIEHRLFLLRREMVRAEFLARAILRISSDPEGERKELQGQLQEIESIAEQLVRLIDNTAAEYEPHILSRYADAAESEGGTND